MSTFGVEAIKKELDTLEGGQPDFDWNRFRTFARLDKKTDESLSRYFRSFVAMCRRVCHLRPGREGTNFYDFFSGRFRILINSIKIFYFYFPPSRPARTFTNSGPDY